MLIAQRVGKQARADDDGVTSISQRDVNLDWFDGEVGGHALKCRGTLAQHLRNMSGYSWESRAGCAPPSSSCAAIILTMLDTEGLPV